MSEGFDGKRIKSHSAIVFLNIVSARVSASKVCLKSGSEDVEVLGESKECVEGLFPDGISESKEDASQMIGVGIVRVGKLLAYFAEQ